MIFSTVKSLGTMRILVSFNLQDPLSIQLGYFKTCSLCGYLTQQKCVLNCWTIYKTFNCNCGLVQVLAF